MSMVAGPVKYGSVKAAIRSLKNESEKNTDNPEEG